MKRFGAALLAVAGQANAGHLLDDVVSTLKNMQKEMEADEASDKLNFAKIKCYCENEIPALEERISVNQDKARNAEKLHGKKVALSEKLASDIEVINKQLDLDRTELSIAETARDKEAGEFTFASTELKNNIAALGEAIQLIRNARDAVKKQQEEAQLAHKARVDAAYEKAAAPRDQLRESASFLQAAPKLNLVEMHTGVKRSMRKFLDATATGAYNIPKGELYSLSAFLQQPSSEAYGSSSDTIFGILERLHTGMSDNLTLLSTNEENAKKAFAMYSKSLKNVIAENEALVNSKTMEKDKADADALSAKDLQNKCEGIVTASQASLEATTANCQAQFKDYTMRSETRAKELKATRDALAVLTSPEIFKLFSNISAGFMQLSAVSTRKSRSRSQLALSRAISVFDKAFKKFPAMKKDVRIQALLAMLRDDEADKEARSGRFSAIISHIDELTEKLQAVIDSDQAEYDGCTKTIDASRLAIKLLRHAIKDLETTKGEQEENIKDYKENIEQDTQMIADIKNSIDKTGYDREQSHSNYLRQMKDNKSGIEVLHKVIGILEESYKSFIQQEPASGYKKPEELEKYEKKDGGAAITLLNNLVTDMEQTLTDLTAQENNEQKLYSGEQTTFNANLIATEQSLASYQVKLGDEEVALEQTLATLASKNDELKGEKEALDGTFKECAFILDNYAKRKDFLGAEIAALGNAKTILSKMDGSGSS